VETIIDRVARVLGIDAAEVRSRNFYGPETRNVTHYGQTVEGNHLAFMFDRLVLDLGMFFIWTPKFLVLPGTKGMPGYGDWRPHLKAQLTRRNVITIRSGHRSLLLVLTLRATSRPLPESGRLEPEAGLEYAGAPACVSL